jgi:hypothetical protein
VAVSMQIMLASLATLLQRKVLCTLAGATRPLVTRDVGGTQPVHQPVHCWQCVHRGSFTSMWQVDIIVQCPCNCFRSEGEADRRSGVAHQLNCSALPLQPDSQWLCMQGQARKRNSVWSTLDWQMYLPITYSVGGRLFVATATSQSAQTAQQPTVTVALAASTYACRRACTRAAKARWSTCLCAVMFQKLSAFHQCASLCMPCPWWVRPEDSPLRRVPSLRASQPPHGAVLVRMHRYPQANSRYVG